MEVTLDEAKTYLRVSSSDEDELIRNLIATATAMVQDIARFSDEEREASEEKILIRMRIAILYTVAYLYEHREEADHSQLNLTLRALLFGVRKEDF
ncbi:MAG TPA: head-tail connector protein [Opitutales bacterium]|nr:head-tail connector protein [Opitutales bacterium]